ncbi:hypothetical protein BDR03DRAFT_515526 [Suillus americanus]|nr:hypothetical protein BDR03DRAFT_515526 [Suillus americanus]
MEQFIWPNCLFHPRKSRLFLEESSACTKGSGDQVGRTIGIVSITVGVVTTVVTLASHVKVLDTIACATSPFYGSRNWWRSAFSAAPLTHP